MLMLKHVCHFQPAVITRQNPFIECVADGYKALDYLQSSHVNIVLSDIKMPGMDGLSLLQEIHSTYPQTHVVMVTAHGEVETYLEAVNLGACDFVHKPVRLNELKLVLEKLSITQALPLP